MKRLSSLARGIYLDGCDFEQAIDLPQTSYNQKPPVFPQHGLSDFARGHGRAAIPFSTRCRQRGQGYGILLGNTISSKEELS
jgi:hypothetical protein